MEPVAGMRVVAESKKRRLDVKNVDFLSGEHKDIPLPENSVDLIIEGWSFLTAYYSSYSEWHAEFEAIVLEMKRILRHQGTVIFIETMGSLHIWEEVPAQTNALYEYFEKELGLKKAIIRTGYKFCNKEDAVDLGKLFFGDEVGAEIQEIGEPVVPEATAIWHGRM
jgi:ubiquinone/menaquinone biosynthesis C-methylase UbiE